MEQRSLGHTGAQVSSLGLGTLTWGRDTDEHEAADLWRTFRDAGGTLIDTATHYGDAIAPSVIGSLLAQEPDRADIHLILKSSLRLGAGPAVIDNSRGHLLNSLDRALRDLGTDYVDTWVVGHYDPATPLEQTAGALAWALRSGRARYVGVSNFPGWALATLHELIRTDGGLALAEMEYSLLERGIEREVIPALAHTGSGLIAWSPLGRGVLTGKYLQSTPPDSRGASTHLRDFVAPYLEAHYAPFVDAVIAAADGLGWTPLEVAFSWVHGSPHVSSALAGARTPAQLQALIDAAQKRLPSQIRRVLDEVSAPCLGYPELLV